MASARKAWAIALLVCFALLALVTAGKVEQVTHKQTFHSPAFELGPGDVVNTFLPLEFPGGHIAIRDFEAEVVDENGNSVALTDVYLHHWVTRKYLVKKGYKELVTSVPKTLDMRQPDIERIAFQEGADAIEVNNDGKNDGRQGSCRDDSNGHYYGLGSETRHTNLALPAPYGQVTGDPKLIPEGYEEAWYLNMHAIDTRDAVDATSCFECLCEAYGVAQDESGQPLSEGYKGGWICCYDKTHCAVREDSNAVKRKYFLKYAVTWVDWDPTVISVRTYLFDVTDLRTSLSEAPDCQVEYFVPQCSKGSASNKCVDRRQSIGAVKIGGDLIHAALHQHSGGLGGVLYYKGGIEICSSNPIYGKGTEPGDEAGYVVGMTSCHPEPGSIYLESMKELQFEAFYSNEVAHTGVMSLFKVQVADAVTFIEEVTVSE